MKKSNQESRTNQRRKYDADFKLSAIRMLKNGQSVVAVSKALGIGENLLYRWRLTHERSLLSEDPLNQIDLLSENESLKRQNKQLETERDILKKALAIFSRTN